MTRRKMVLTLVLCSSMALLAVQALSQARSSSRSTRASDAESRRKMTDAKRRKESAERRRQRELKNKELAKEGRGLPINRKQQAEQKRKEAAERIREFSLEKSALGPTEEQWEVIKPKLEEVRQLKGRANSAVGVFLGGGASDIGAKAAAPAWQWKRPWKDKNPDELTEAQKLAKQIVALVGRNSTTPQAFRLKMDALRKARGEEAELKRQLFETRRELRELLTPRQEAALVLMKRL